MNIIQKWHTIAGPFTATEIKLWGQQPHYVSSIVNFPQIYIAITMYMLRVCRKVISTWLLLSFIHKRLQVAELLWQNKKYDRNCQSSGIYEDKSRIIVL